MRRSAEDTRDNEHHSSIESNKINSCLSRHAIRFLNGNQNVIWRATLPRVVVSRDRCKRV